MTKGINASLDAVLASARLAASRPELAHQSLGRSLTAAEEALADALMEIYASGVWGLIDVAAALSKKGVVLPIAGGTEWTADSVVKELAELNAELDDAYQENGFGA